LTVEREWNDDEAFIEIRRQPWKMAQPFNRAARASAAICRPHGFQPPGRCWFRDEYRHAAVASTHKRALSAAPRAPPSQKQPTAMPWCGRRSACPDTLLILLPLEP